MKKKRLFTVLGMVAVLAMALVSVATAADLVVVATPATFAKAEKWVNFLKSKEIPVRNVAPSDLAAFKEEPYVILMGGMDEADGIKPVAEKVLSKAEFEWINKPGNKKMYLKYDVWFGGQEIIVFAGADGAGAEAARVGSRDEWWTAISEWFEIEEEVGAAGGTPSY
ncbi:MAG TPA: hypothetical protein PLA74_05325 [Syntrophales bacterium]|nr:hypothetical protein [Syntrophales bacterium]HPQ44960.1 hypothetical protein [Syntrophales bacterium]